MLVSIAPFLLFVIDTIKPKAKPEPKPVVLPPQPTQPTQPPTHSIDPIRVKQNQKLLDKYFNGIFGGTARNIDQEKGKLYEYFVGYLYWKKGYEIEYRGAQAKNGKGDGGIDLICKNDKEILIIQCKNQKKSVNKTQMKSFTEALSLYKEKYLGRKNVKGIFFTTSSFSTASLQEASLSHIELKMTSKKEISKPFPVVRCTREDGFYSIPTDAQYDSLKLKAKKGDCYCLTILEAEKQGFLPRQNYIIFNNADNELLKKLKEAQDHNQKIWDNS